MKYTYPTADCAQPVKYKRILRALASAQENKAKAAKIEQITSEIKHISLVIASRKKEIEHLQLAQFGLLLEMSNISE